MTSHGTINTACKTVVIIEFLKEKQSIIKFRTTLFLETILWLHMIYAYIAQEKHRNEIQ